MSASAAGAAATDWDQLTARFESLGDNCEFGFVLRALGNEAGGLLRWAVTGIRPLLRLLEADFAPFYEFDNLRPQKTANMVEDQATGLSFHTRMLCVDERFTQDEAERRAIHRDELAKYQYLIEKFRARLADPATIFVLTGHGGIDQANVAALHGWLRRHGRANLLQVVTGIAAPRLCWRQDGWMVGTLDRYAPWSQADEISLECWKRLMIEADRLTG